VDGAEPELLLQPSNMIEAPTRAPPSS